MKALDTNILLRYFIRDDPKQASLAKEFIQAFTAEKPGFINLITLNELVWALKKIYRYGKPLIADTVQKILETDQLEIENSEAAALALALYREHNVDFADALIGVVNRHADCTKTVTFDKKAAKLNEFELLK